MLDPCRFALSNLKDCCSSFHAVSNFDYKSWISSHNISSSLLGQVQRQELSETFDSERALRFHCLPIMAYPSAMNFCFLFLFTLSFSYGITISTKNNLDRLSLEQNETVPDISRILNGRNANSEEVKRFVQLHLTFKKRKRLFYRYTDVICGAIMHRRRWLISAAHCFVDIDNTGYRYHQKGSYVRYGRNDFDQGYRTNIERVYLHKNFVDKNTLPYDIALILLTEDLNGYNGKPVVNGASTLVNLVTMGFGDTSQTDDRTPDILKAGELGTGNCIRRNRDGSSGSQMISCYSGSSLPRICRGDSGGPLLSKSSSSSYTLAGIVSHGTAGTCPNAFTDMWFTDYSRFSTLVYKATSEGDFSGWKVQP